MDKTAVSGTLQKINDKRILRQLVTRNKLKEFWKTFGKLNVMCIHIDYVVVVVTAAAASARMY